MTVTVIFLRRDVFSKKGILLRMAGCTAFGMTVILVSTRLGTLLNGLFPVQSTPGAEVVTGAVSLTLQTVLSGFWRFCVSGLGLLPAITLPGIAALLPCVLLWKRNRRLQLSLCLLSLFCYVLSFAFVFAMGESGMTGRLLGGLYATQAMLLCATYHFMTEKRRKQGLLLFGAACLVVQTVFCNIIMMNHYISNAKDLAYARAVYEQILYYEHETGNTVDTLLYTRDAVCRDSYEDVYYKFGEINRRCIHTNGWILVSYTALSDGRTFARGDMDAAARERYFGDKNWEDFVPQEQLVFQGSTLYWCVY